MTRTASRLLAASFLVAFLQLFQFSAFARPGASSATPGLADGPGIWINLWSYPDGDLDAFFSKLRNHGIRNIYLQTSRSNTEALPHADKLGPILEASHRNDIRVMAWGFAQLFDPAADAEKLAIAAEFESQNGHRFDGIAGNMEVNLAKWKVESYSQRLRQRLGQNYPMVAVVFSPLNKATQAVFTPWKTIAQYWDVLAPMTYWGGKYQKVDAYSYTKQTINKVRELCGKSDIEIHPIGDGMKTSAESIHAFMKACRDCEAPGASLYPDQKVTASQLAVLSRFPDYFPSNARFRMAAFKELRRSGAVAEPPSLDPSRYISRGELYKLVVRQLFSGLVGEMTPLEALQVLVNSGLVPTFADPMTAESALASPVTARESYALVASIIDARMRPKVRRQARQKGRMDSWFIQPARAEASQYCEPQVKPITYIDAAQIVLQARAGL
jgi:hypothetical protein